jgi:hypothetical protein
MKPFAPRLQIGKTGPLRSLVVTKANVSSQTNRLIFATQFNSALQNFQFCNRQSYESPLKRAIGSPK